jgi:polyisoprenoid-binding protein YceI
MTTTLTEQAIPAGTWALDKVHSTVGYSVRHSGLSLFKGGLTEFDASLVDGVLRGSANVASITVQDENLGGHLLSPDFFDAERFPQVTFTSTSVARDGDTVTVDGELEIRGNTRPVTLTGTIAGPVGDKIGLHLETTIDRTAFGMNWQMQLPSGVGAIQPDDIASIDITKHAAGVVAPNAVSIISIVLKPGAKVPLVAHNP